VSSAVATPHTGDPSLTRMARKSGINLVGAAVAAVTNFALIVVLTRELSKDQAGLFFTATSVFLLAAILAKMGTQTGLVYFVARQRAQHSAELIPFILRTGLLPVFVAGLIGAAALALTGAGILEFASGSSIRTVATDLIVLAPFLPAAALSDSLLAATRGFGTMRVTVLVENISRSSVQLALVATTAAIAGGHAFVPILAWAAPYLMSSAWAALKVRRLTSRALGDRLPARTADGLRRAFWSFTGPRAFASVAQVLLQRLDIVLVAALRGPADAAVYTAATRLLVAGQLGGSAIASAVQPRLAGTLSTENFSAARAAYQSATSWLILLTWPFYLLCIVDAPIFLRIFGHGYTTATSVVVILAASMLLATACGMVDGVLSMGGRTRWSLVNSLNALAINVVLDLILVPRYGIGGAAIGWAAAIAANNVVPLGQIWRFMRLHPFGNATLLCMTLTTVSFGVIPGAYELITGTNTLLHAAQGAVAGGIVMLGLTWWLRGPIQLDRVRLRVR
jgi:O-antigen/teichoic acid export membrane protein